MSHRVKVKIDGNQHDIVDALFAVGCTVQTLALVGAGCPDLLAARRGQMWLFEVKQPGEKPNELQRKWHETWDAPVHVVHTAEEAINALEAR
jgi:hypothetical protein